MPAKEHVKQIGRCQYKYQQMTMTPALELLSALSAFFGEAVAPLARGGIDLDKELDPNIIASCVHSLMAKLGNSEEVIGIVKRINAQGQVAVPLPGGKGKDLVLLSREEAAETHFGEHIGNLPGWLAFALGAQFGDFFGSLGGGMLRGVVAKMTTTLNSTSPSTSTSDGPSSDSSQTSASPPPS